MVAPIERYSLVGLGSLRPTFLGDAAELYFESYYFHRELTNQASAEQMKHPLVTSRFGIECHDRVIAAAGFDLQVAA